MITRTDAERLAAAIHAIRHDWPLEQLMTLIAELRSWPLVNLGVGLAHVALDRTLDGQPVSKSPYRVKEQGPWRTVGVLDIEAEQRREREARDYAERKAAITTRTQAITNCNLCDNHGYRGAYVCQHNREASEAAHRGATLARANLRPLRADRAWVPADIAATPHPETTSPKPATQGAEADHA